MSDHRPFCDSFRDLISAAVLTSILAIAPLLAAPPLEAQEASAEGSPRWTVGLELGAQFPARFYNQRVTAVLPSEGFRESTRYSERIDPLPFARAILRYRPDDDFGGYLAYQRGAAATTASFHGSGDASLNREIDLSVLEFGISVKLGSPRQGRGQFEYSVGAAGLAQRLDLSSGHRDSFARIGTFSEADDFDWRDRTFRSWALSLSFGGWYAVGDRFRLRGALHDYVVDVPTEDLANVEEAEVQRLTNHTPMVNYSSYTAHYPSFRAGVEYVLTRERPRAAPEPFALPPINRTDAPRSGAVEQARVALESGDTAAAIATLRRRVEEVDDVAAWRDLGLILAVAARERPVLLEQARGTLQRALELNPGDGALLEALGRVESGIEVRGGEGPFRPVITGFDVEHEGPEQVTLEWSVRNLDAPLDGGMASYRVEVEVVSRTGSYVPLRGADTDEDGMVRRLISDREVENPGPVGEVRDSMTITLPLETVGEHTVWLRVVDLRTGQAVSGSGTVVLPRQ